MTTVDSCKEESGRGSGMWLVVCILLQAVRARGRNGILRAAQQN